MLYQGIIGGGSSPVEDLSPVLLWTNSNPGATFAAQTVSLDLTKYAGVLIESITNGIDSTTYVKKTEKGACGTIGSETGGGAARVANVSETNVVFSDAYALDTITNTAARPTKIYGVKEYVVEPVSPITKDLLWTNPSPTAELSRTEISGDYSKYKSILVKAKISTDKSYKIEANIYKKVDNYVGGIYFRTLNTKNSVRSVEFTDTLIIIDEGADVMVSTGAQVNTNNSICIITEIYGIE